MITRTTFTELTKIKIQDRISQMINENLSRQTILEETQKIILEEYGKKSLVCSLETKLESIQNDAFKLAEEMITDSYFKREIKTINQNTPNNQTIKDEIIEVERTHLQKNKLDTEKKAKLNRIISKIQCQAAKLEVIEFLWTNDNKNKPSLKKEMAYNLLSTARKKLFTDTESCLEADLDTVEIQSLLNTIETTNEFLLQLNNNTSQENLQELFDCIVAELTTLSISIKEISGT